MKILAAFYLFLILLYALPLFIFSTRLVVLGKYIWGFLAVMTYAFFLVFFFCLFRAIRSPNTEGFLMLQTFHIFFLLNSLLLVFDHTPIFAIEGAQPVMIGRLKRTIVIMSALINSIILFYVFYKRSYFIDNERK
ncbi:MAG: hypothetical protein JSW40_07685 [Candidatus Omnitrophota bacterium]|nr:MAG: hypothetical protein JSW40_07685 [Candidatus Omnitrophota bacterium]